MPLDVLAPPLPPPAPSTRAAGTQKKASVNDALESANRSSDAQRVDATVPRDSVQLYRKLHSMGLQYGPAFQLLQTVRVPEDFGAE